MTQDERITIDEVSRVLRDATRDYVEYRTFVELAELAAKTIERLRAELATAKAESPRPAAMLWTDATEWHAYERWQDADRDRNQAAQEPPLMVVKKWTWHPKPS